MHRLHCSMSAGVGGKPKQKIFASRRRKRSFQSEDSRESEVDNIMFIRLPDEERSKAMPFSISIERGHIVINSQTGDFSGRFAELLQSPEDDTLSISVLSVHEVQLLPFEGFCFALSTDRGSLLFNCPDGLMQVEDFVEQLLEAHDSLLDQLSSESL